MFAWGLQVAAIAALGLVLPVLVRLTSPDARLVYLRGLLVVCLALPFIQPWVPLLPAAPSDGIPVPLVLTDSLALASGAAGVAAPPPLARSPFPRRWPPELILGAVYLAGLAGRLAWMGLGLLSLARLRRGSTPLTPRPVAVDDAALMVGQDADFRVSERVVRPATFGLRHPVVLVPPGFTEFTTAQQTAIAAHELLHVRRRDWVRALADRLLLSVFWFHPVLWWLIEQIHLSVEQVVDREVVGLVGERRPYLEALLKLAEAGPVPVLQPASLFLKHGHLAQRVALLVREASMSRVRLVVSFVVVLAVLVTSGMMVVQAWPLRGLPEPAVAAEPLSGRSLPGDGLYALVPLATAELTDAVTGTPSVEQAKPTVDPKAQAPRPGMPPPPPPPAPPNEAMMLEKIKANPQDVSWYFVLSSFYEKGGRLADAERVLLDARSVQPQSTRVLLQLAGYYSRQHDFDKCVEALFERTGLEPGNPEGFYTLATYYWDRAYRKTDLAPGEKGQLVEKGLAYVDEAIRLKSDYFEALTYKNLLLRLKATTVDDASEQERLIAQADKLRDEALRLKQQREKWDAVPANAVRVGGTIKPPSKIKDVKPVFPEAAQNARVQGVVILEILINEEGKVQAKRVLRSIPFFDEPAMTAVGGWEFTPTLLNGVPVPVVMTVTVNFTLDGVAGDVFVVAPPPPPPPPPPGAKVFTPGGVAGGVAGGVVGGVQGGVAGGAVRVGGTIGPPIKTYDVRPVYPPEAKDAGIQGVVIIEATIGADGKVKDAKVLRSIPQLDQAAVDAVRQWEFTPTVLNGVPVPVIITVTVSFMQ
jgi:TonB family protein